MPTARPTAADALTRALDRTRRVLFEPFDLAKYVTLGFCVWLAQVGSTTGNVSSWGGRSRGGSGGGTLPNDVWDEITRVMNDWGAVLLAGIGAATLVAVAVWILLLFLQCRGLFMTIDGIVRNRGAVVEPWQAYAAEADALFRFRLTLALLLLVAATVLTGGVAVGWWVGRPAGPLELGAVAVGGVVLGLMALLRGIADACATEFVAPMMYVRRYGVHEGFADLRTYVGADLGGFVLYVLLRFVVAVFAAFAAATIVCLTCGVAMLPFVGTLILLPLFVWMRSYALQFVAQQAEDLAATLVPGG